MVLVSMSLSRLERICHRLGLGLEGIDCAHPGYPYWSYRTYSMVTTIVTTSLDSLQTRDSFKTNRVKLSSYSTGSVN